MEGLRPALAAAGVDLILVGNGSPDQARAFHAAKGLGMPLFVDPGLRVYRALGLARGLRATLSWRGLARAFRAFRAGHRQGSNQGDPWQQGGVFLVRPDGTFAFAYRSQTAGDHPADEELMAAVRHLQAG